MDETTAVPPTSPPPAGWYPDPLGGEHDRWWTGHGWSEQTQQRIPVPPPAYPTALSYEPMAAAGAEYPYPRRDPLSQPLPGATIAEAFVRFWSKYAVFSGRASRSEYWWWNLVFAVIYVAALILEAVLGKDSPGYLAVSIFFFLFVVAGLVPTYALLSRRLHDANLSAWNILWALVPLAGGIVMLVLTTRASDPAGRRFDAF
jgi:uncharacterized membrane protein YhaH (DUF805 family)